MDFDLWKAVDNISWDTFDFKVYEPVIDEKKTVTQITEPFDFSDIKDSYQVIQPAPKRDNYPCNFALNRILNVGPVNYRTVIGSG